MTLFILWKNTNADINTYKIQHVFMAIKQKNKSKSFFVCANCKYMK